eukprot:COSAG06_NODE_2623_length_6562_cov_9.546031_11_plen_67_part_00
MCFSMYEISSLRFILLVAGHSRFLIVDACLRRMVSDVVGEALAAAHRSYASERTCSGLIGGAAERR